MSSKEIMLRMHTFFHKKDQIGRLSPFKDLDDKDPAPASESMRGRIPNH